MKAISLAAALDEFGRQRAANDTESEFEQLITEALDEAFDEHPVLRCPFCGSSPILHRPKPHATHPEPCGFCAAATTPPPREIRGILAGL